MAKLQFKYYLHDDHDSTELVEAIAERVGLNGQDPVFEKIDRPFYEVELDCELDTETGDIKILGARA